MSGSFLTTTSDRNRKWNGNLQISILLLFHLLLFRRSDGSGIDFLTSSVFPPFLRKKSYFFTTFSFFPFLFTTRKTYTFRMHGHCALTLISQNVPQQKILGASVGIPPNASKEGEKETGPNGKIFPSFSSFFRTHENFFSPSSVRTADGAAKGRWGGRRP